MLLMNRTNECPNQTNGILTLSNIMKGDSKFRKDSNINFTLLDRVKLSFALYTVLFIVYDKTYSL